MFGQRLKEIRKQNGDTQQQLADKLGMSKYAVSMWEQERASPNFEKLVEICRLYNVSSDYLLGLEKPRKTAMDDTELLIKHLKHYINSLEDK